MIPREEIVRRFAPGRSWLDVGCMWSVHGAISFLAEEVGAASVTGIDVMARTPEFEAEHARRRSSVRFVGGDLHDPATLAEAGEHDVVWCTGVLYHAPHPLLTLERLRAVCRETLILGTEALPPGLPSLCVFYPGLSPLGRRVLGRLAPGRAIGLTEPFDAAAGYGNWFWGMTPRAVRAMLRTTGFDVVEEHGNLHYRLVIARPSR